ncbi:hypothetical protein GCM10009678_68200 [Actinomadura kijaniata]
MAAAWGACGAAWAGTLTATDAMAAPRATNPSFFNMRFLSGVSSVTDAPGGVACHQMTPPVRWFHRMRKGFGGTFRCAEKGIIGHGGSLGGGNPPGRGAGLPRPVTQITGFGPPHPAKTNRSYTPLIWVTACLAVTI